ncbi:hypothetical protein R3P38DRAFT_334961 [Favolaschia claudopus]|uniref:Uncharacterized protein n=1 Tax=Favolaschia claudopus TaxID=2862362 RepID=A0AAV9ZKZ5_9AGAR
MPPFRSLLHTIQSFRLGYNSGPQQPYPGRWTTLLIILFFSLLTGFLVCINVPLSAYDFVEEITFRPNDTVPDPLLSSWLPSVHIAHLQLEIRPANFQRGRHLAP